MLVVTITVLFLLHPLKNFPVFYILFPNPTTKHRQRHHHCRCSTTNSLVLRRRRSYLPTTSAIIRQCSENWLTIYRFRERHTIQFRQSKRQPWNTYLHRQLNKQSVEHNTPRVMIDHYWWVAQITRNREWQHHQHPSNVALDLRDGIDLLPDSSVIVNSATYIQSTS